MISPARLAIFSCFIALPLTTFVVGTNAADDSAPVIIERAPESTDPAAPDEARQLRIENQRLLSTVKDLQTKADTAQATVDVLTTRNQQLESGLAAARARASELDAAKSADLALAATVTAEKTRADEAVARLNTLVAVAARLEQEKTALESRLAEARQSEARLREELAAVPTAQSDLQAKLADAETKLAEARRSQALVQAENDVLRAGAAEHARNAADLQSLRSEKSALETQLADLRATEASLRQQLAAAPAAGELSPEQKARLAETEDKLATALRSFSLLQTENERLKAANNDTAKLTAEVEALRADKAALETRLASAAAPEAADLSARLAETENKLATTLRSFALLQAENERLKSDASNTPQLNREIETLRADKNALEARLAAGPSPAASPDLSARLAETENKLNTTLRSFTLLQAENDRLKADAGTAVDRAAASAADSANTSAAQISALFDELRQTKAQATALAAENSQLKTRLALAGSPPGSTLASPTRPGAAPRLTAEPSMGSPEAAPDTADTANRQHVVVLGDTLAKISRRYYGTPGRWDEILEANRDVVQNENALPVGATLRIP